MTKFALLPSLAKEATKVLIQALSTLRANKYSMLDDDLCASLQQTKALRSTSHVGNKHRTNLLKGLPGLDPCTMILANEIKLGSINFT
ncbi:hypothetical protein AAG906_011094 [Vitis piasezkii]